MHLFEHPRTYKWKAHKNRNILFQMLDPVIQIETWTLVIALIFTLT